MIRTIGAGPATTGSRMGRGDSSQVAGARVSAPRHSSQIDSITVSRLRLTRNRNPSGNSAFLFAED